MLPVLTHLLVTLLHLRKVLLERGADGRLLLVVQAVIEVQPRRCRLLAQLSVLLLDLLMGGVHRVQVENRLLLHRLELLLHLLMIRTFRFMALLHGVERGLPLLFLIRVQLQLPVQLIHLFHEVAMMPARTAGAAHAARARRRLCSESRPQADGERGSSNGEKA